MHSEIKFSVIIPAYNPGKKIIPCLKSLGKNLNYFSKNSKLTYEVLIINDAGDQININFNHTFNTQLFPNLYITLRLATKLILCKT